jgi:hypothetical protein
MCLHSAPAFLIFNYISWRIAILNLIPLFGHEGGNDAATGSLNSIDVILAVLKGHQFLAFDHLFTRFDKPFDHVQAARAV